MSDLNKPVNMGDLQETTQRIADWAKAYITAAIAAQPTPVDPTIPALIQALDQINGEVIGTTAQEKVSPILNVKRQMATIFAEAGFTGTQIFSRYPSFLSSIIKPTGVYVEDTEGRLWTPANWEAYHTTEVPYCMVLLTSAVRIRIGFAFTSLSYGSAVEVKGMQMFPTQASVLADDRDNMDSTKALIAFYNPAELGKDASGVYSKARLLVNLSTTSRYYETVAEMEANAPHDTSLLFIVNNAGSTDGTGMHCYYWNNSSFVDLGVRPVNQGSDPYKGAPAALYCWKYKAVEGDTRKWSMMKGNMAQLMWANMTDINACYKAVKGTAFATGSVWVVEQASSASNAWYARSASSFLNDYKASSKQVWPVAPYDEEDEE